MSDELEKLVEEHYLLLDLPLDNEREEEEYFKKLNEILSRIHSYANRERDDEFFSKLYKVSVKVGKRLGRPVSYCFLSDQLSDYAYSLLSPEEQREKGYL